MKIHPEEDKYDLNRHPKRTYVSRRIDDKTTGRPVRIANKVFEAPQHAAEAALKDEIVLRVTDGGKQAVRAAYFEDDRQLRTLTIQRFTYESGKPHEKTSLSFWGDQIPRLLEFVMNIKAHHLKDSGKLNISDDELREIVLSDAQLHRLALENQDALVAIVENKVTKRDVTAFAYRKRQLDRLRQLLDDRAYFDRWKQKLGLNRDEDLWQRFFEHNKWIFGYGLSFISMSALDDRQLQQITSGASVASHGKRPDALMKTRGIINSLCFAEIKNHEAPLLKATSSPFRSGAWEPSSDLVAGIAQAQATVHASVKQIGDRLDVRTKTGYPTGEQLYDYEPRSFLVIGSNQEFMTEHGPNEDKYRSFELFRRNVRRPEIITFDELYERAALILAIDDHHET